VSDDHEINTLTDAPQHHAERPIMREVVRAAQIAAYEFLANAPGVLPGATLADYLDAAHAYACEETGIWLPEYREPDAATQLAAFDAEDRGRE